MLHMAPLNMFKNSVLISGNPVNTLYDTLLIHIDIHRSCNAITNYPTKPFIRDFLQALKNVNNQSSILPIDLTSFLGCITMENDISSSDKLSKYVDGISIPMNKHPNNDNSNIICFHLHISATLPLWQLKRNTLFYDWLIKNKIFLHTHGFTMTYKNALSAGFLSYLSPIMHHCDTMKNIIDAAAHDKGLNLEIRLVPWNIPYGQNNKKRTTNAVEVLVDHASVNIVREMMIKLFQTKPDAILADV